MMITSKDLEKIGFGPTQSMHLVRKAKAQMVKDGFSWYDNPRLGTVPLKCVEKILGTKLELDEK